MSSCTSAACGRAAVLSPALQSIHRKQALNPPHDDLYLTVASRRYRTGWFCLVGIAQPPPRTAEETSDSNLLAGAPHPGVLNKAPGVICLYTNGKRHKLFHQYNMACLPGSSYLRKHGSTWYCIYNTTGPHHSFHLCT